ncbi:MAG: UDP-N-acetylmuramate dehydrogenase [Anaerovoracaceae bacterium]|jgi:UDP-N-acetylmuramate dehydrogenase
MDRLLEEKIRNLMKEGAAIKDAPMKEYTSFKAGGSADLLLIPGSVDELEAVVGALAAEGEDFLVMGNGSNFLVKDGGYRGTIIRISDCCGDIRGEGPLFTAGAAVSLSAFAKYALEKGYEGFEFASGIPGSIGGGAFMNAGAYGGELKDVISCVRVIRRDGSGRAELSVKEMDYGYRHSVLYDTLDIVTEVDIELRRGRRDEIAARMKDLNGRRNAKQPINYPSAGSFFKRPPGYYAGKLIQDSGLKGLTVGGAQVSELHAGFIINKGGATASDIVELMHLVQARVSDRFGVQLEPEVRIIGED